MTERASQVGEARWPGVPGLREPNCVSPCAVLNDLPRPVSAAPVPCWLLPCFRSALFAILVLAILVRGGSPSS